MARKETRPASADQSADQSSEQGGEPTSSDVVHLERQAVARGERLGRAAVDQTAHAAAETEAKRRATDAARREAAEAAEKDRADAAKREALKGGQGAAGMVKVFLKRAQGVRFTGGGFSGLYGPGEVEVPEPVARALGALKIESSG